MSLISIIKVSENEVKFIFSTNTNKELPLIVGQLPVLPKHYWEDKNFEETTFLPILYILFFHS